MAELVEKRELVRRAITKKGLTAKQIAKLTEVSIAHVKATLRKLMTAQEVEVYQEFEPTMGRNVAHYIKAVPHPNARRIKSITKDKYKLQSKWERSERVSSKTYVGISSIYYG